MNTLVSYICLCWILLLGVFNVNAQQLVAPKLDSLELQLRNSKDPIEETKALQDLSDYWIYKDSAQAMDYAYQILERNANNLVGQGIGYHYIGGVMMEHRNLEGALEAFEKGKQLFEQDTSLLAKEYLAKLWHNIGAIQQRRGDNKAFLDILLHKAIPILEEINDTLTIGRNYFDIAWIFMNMRQYKQGYDYFEQATSMLKPYPQYEDLVESYLGSVQALIYSDDQGEKIIDDPKAKAKELLMLSRKSLEMNPDAYPWLRYYVVAGMYEEHFEQNADAALRHYENGFALSERRKEQYFAGEFLNRQYYLYDEQKDYTKAKAVLYELYERLKGSEIKHDQLLALKNLVAIEEKTGNIAQAFHYLKAHNALSDSLKIEEQTVSLAEMERKYQHEKKEREILQLKADNEHKTLALQRNSTLLIFSVILLVGLIALVGLGYMLYRNKQQLAQNQQALHREQLDRLERDQQLNFYNAMIQGQEQERKRLAQDLHDGLGGLLSNVKLLLSKEINCEENPDAWKLHQHQLLGKLDVAVNELRRIARNMMPETLLRFGLVTALRDYCDDLEKLGINISLQTYGITADKHKNEQIMIYRILQELISNAVKHADAKNIIVQCVQDTDSIYLTVEDDGAGFDQQDLGEKKGIGLTNVKNRVAYLKGKLDIQSEKNVGTTINIEFHV